jgi:hypothetical protein
VHSPWHKIVFTAVLEADCFDRSVHSPWHKIVFTAGLEAPDQIARLSLILQSIALHQTVE